MKSTERLEIKLHSSDPVERRIFEMLQEMSERGGGSVSTVLKKLTLIFTPAALETGFLDIHVLQNKACVALSQYVANGGSEPIATFAPIPEPASEVRSNGESFEPIPEF